nr:hypothetical protein [uncultured Draconibacterium sp.]
MIQNKDLLRKCLKEIEIKLNWVDSTQWQQKHFESLSEIIYKKTNVSLSPLTLKRLWGKVKYDSTPSASTLDTLARFLDHDDWIDYQCNKSIHKTFNLKLNYLKNKKAILITSIIIGVLALIIGAVKLNAILFPKDYSNFEFSVQKLSSNLPNTVYFKYNVKDTDADSVIIQQSWDPKLHHIVDKNKTDFSCIYYYPGYYKTKLVLDNKVVSQKDLYVNSNGWLGIIHKEPIPIYLNSKDILDSNVISIKESHLLNAGFDLNLEVPYSTINLVEEFDSIQGDDFELQARFKQTYPKGEAICQKSALIILCEDGYFYIPQSIKGCVNELNMYIPDKVINAIDSDLSDLGIENAAIVNLKLKVSNGIFDLKINNNKNIVDTLSLNPGKIVGVKIGFHGTGEVYSLSLKSGNGEYTMRDFLP